MNSIKTALVLGSSRGVGKAIAEELRKAGIDAPTISSKEIDTSDRASVLAFAQKHPSTDVLVLNTGGPPKKDFFEIQREEWEKYHQQLFLSLVALLQMVEVHRGGYIFLISSHLISEPKENMILSQTYRLASWSMLKALTKHFAARNVSVLNIALGPILTDRLKNLTADIPALEGKLPMKRAGTPEEVGRFVRSIVEGDIKYLTGVSITFDGGLSSAIL
ncbi:MAG: short-chain dehydrogenase/reductase SDR [Parcubacteria group bacterium Gr01-1014_91]|nr:MAG: short-chain dehydrogenase/reductase SDR [Parcubacteria group bacterium Gr01-1014_91]